VAKDKSVETGKKKKSKIRMLFKWIRRITLVAGIVSAVRRYQAENSNSQTPPRT
jgi:hypothetical protein